MNLDGANDKQRLTAEQKKRNHIESEKKRREAIRRGFEKLAEIVPECEGQARSESVVLQRTVAYLKEQVQRKAELKQIALTKGMSELEFEQVYRDVEQAMNEADEGGTNNSSPTAGPSNSGGR